MGLQTPKGTFDLLPEATLAVRHIENCARETFERYGYQQMQTPIFELTEVFVRGIGEATDVVGKEMYHVFSQDAAVKLAQGARLEGSQQLTLRPEGTAGIARAVVQHNLVAPGAPPAKLWYLGPMFRHERQQKGRYRQFSQIGAEFLGAAQPTADAEVIIMLMQFFVACGIPAQAMRLFVNSMGDANCRPAYRDAVRSCILQHQEELCPECVRRAQTNPLRAFDCKNPACVQVMKQAPLISDFLCADCARHYAQLKALLGAEGVAFEEDPRLVRGLDYYTRTVFEVQVDVGLGTQNAIGGGGRYDRLLEEFGGKPTPGLGFAVGLERINLVLDELCASRAALAAPEVFVAAAGEAEIRAEVFTLSQKLRAAGLRAQLDHQDRSLKSQLKLADKSGAALCLIIGPDELACGRFVLRDMKSHEERQVDKREAVETVLAALR